MKRVHIVTDVDLIDKSAQPVHLISLAKYLGRLGLEVRLIYPFWQREAPEIPLGVIGVPNTCPPENCSRRKGLASQEFY